MFKTISTDPGMTTARMRHGVRLGLLALSLLVAGCGGGHEGGRDTPPATTTAEYLTLDGKIHCGAVRQCKGDAFLVYTDHGGKVLIVTPTAERSTADVLAHLADGAPVRITGIPKSKVANHQYEISADQLVFPPRPAAEPPAG